MSSPSGTEASTTSSSPISGVPTAVSGGNNAPKYGTLIPNRIFVGGISGTTTEAELAQLFSAYGNVRATKIINDRAGVSKGYGFVTFETEEEARRLQAEADCIVLKERKLNIAPAIKKQAAAYSLQPFNRGYENTPTAPSGTVFFHNGYPYTYYNGTAFFTGTNGTQDVAAAANGYVASPYPQPQPTPSYPATTLMFQQPMYIPQQYQYPTMPPSNPAPPPFLYTPAAASNSLYGTINGGGGGNGGGGNSNGGGGGGGGGPPNMTTSNHHHHTTTFYATGPPPTSTLPPRQGPPALPPILLPPPPPQHHHHHPQPPLAQMTIPEMFMTGPATASYAQQAGYPMPVTEIFEAPPVRELSSAQSTEDSSSNSSRSGPSNPSNGGPKVNGEGGAKITPTTPVVSLLRLNLQDEGDDEVEGGGGGSVEGESLDQGEARQTHKALRTPAQQSNQQHKRVNVNGVTNQHRYQHRPRYYRPNQMHPNSVDSGHVFMPPDCIQSQNHFAYSPATPGFYPTPPPVNGPPQPSSLHMHNSSVRGQHHGGNRPPQPHDQRHFGGRPRPNQRSPHPNIPEGKKYSHCVPEGLLSCRSPPLQGSTAIVYSSIPMIAPNVNMGGGGGRQQNRRFTNGPRRQGSRSGGGSGSGGGGGGGGDAGDVVRPVQVLPSSGQQRQKVGKCNKTVNGTRQGSSTNAGVSGSTENNMPQDGSGDGPCMPITPPGTPSPATARELPNPVTAVGPETVCQMQALSL